MKKYKIGNDIYKIDLNALEVIGEGKEGCVYSWNEFALKIFNSERLKFGYCLSEDKFSKLKNISVDRFILCDDLVFEKKQKKYEFIGHTMKKINKCKPMKQFFKKNLNSVINEIKLIESDVEVLTDYNIEISDCNHNYIYNGNLNIIDCGYYRLHDIPNNELKILNNISINDFFINNLLLNPVCLKLNKTDMFSEILLNDINKTKNDLVFSSMIENLASKNNFDCLDDIQRKYVKKLFRNF